MPLTAKGEEILANLTKEYGAEKAKQVLYAGKNSGKFTGIDSARPDAAEAMQKCADALVKISERVDSLLIRQRTGHERSLHDDARKDAEQEVKELPERASRKAAASDQLNLLDLLR
jgi:hypothetical protein